MDVPGGRRGAQATDLAGWPRQRRGTVAVHERSHRFDGSPPLLTLAASLLAALGLVAFAAWWAMIRMPGTRFASPPPAGADRRLVRALRGDLEALAGRIGERNLSRRPAALDEAGAFIETALAAAGYGVERQRFDVGGREVFNVIAECGGARAPGRVVMVGAHYDTVPGSPGANDNGSAVAAGLALARRLVDAETPSTLRYVFFVNEEAPYYMTEAMGSLRHARRCAERGEDVVAMICLETIGCYLDEPGTQRYPVSALHAFYPNVGNFAAVVGNVASRKLIRRVTGGLRAAGFPAQGLAAPGVLRDIFRSDHAAYWRYGFPALMVTDTADFRYAHYHTPQDTVDKVDVERLALLVEALEPVLVELAAR